ncbi:MAG TPA: hypothetical protein VFY93_01250 [Planctomycetota bacterium]|nr:hypothetical protein [Planctomycetota bacterium]
METDVEEAAPAHVDTPHGRLHRPLGHGRQGLVLVAAFFGGPGLGWVVGSVPGDLSEAARTFLCVPFVAVFFLGYAAWIAHLKVIAFKGLGVPLLKALFQLIVRRRTPRSVGEVMPSRETLLAMAVEAQAAGAAFRRIGWLVGIGAGLVAALFESAMSGGARFALAATACVAWGYALALLARRGWLPIMEES